MDPLKLPANTSYTYPHLFYPHPYFRGNYLQPINPAVQWNAVRVKIPDFQVDPLSNETERVKRGSKRKRRSGAG